MENNYKKTAYHEAGHIVFAYLVGYYCNNSEILLATGDGKTEINYDDDLIVVASITNSLEHPDMFNGLSADKKATSLAVSNRIANVYLAGPASETIFLKEDVNSTDEIEISADDLKSINNIHHFLAQIKKNHQENYVHETLTGVSAMLTHIAEIRAAVEPIAKELLEKKRITRKEIETILTDTGFFAYRDNNN